MPSQRPGISRETHREEAGVEVEQRHEHQHQQDAASELHVLPGGALPHGGHACEHALALGAGLSQQQQQAASQGQVPAGHTPRRSLGDPRPASAGRAGRRAQQEGDSTDQRPPGPSALMRHGALTCVLGVQGWGGKGLTNVHYRV